MHGFAAHVPDHSMVMWNVVCRGDQSTNIRDDFVEWTRKKLDTSKSADYDFGITGFDAMQFDSSALTKSDMSRIDSITMPIAFAVLGYVCLLVVLWFIIGSLLSVFVFRFFFAYMIFPS